MITQTSFFGFPLRTAAQRRWLVVLYYALLVGFASGGMVHNGRLPFALLFQTLLLGGLLGGIRAGGPVKAYAEPRLLEGGGDDTRPIVLGLDAVRQRVLGRREWTPLDERETTQRDRAHFVAYRVLMVLAGVAAVVYWCAWQWYPLLLAHGVPMQVWFLLMVTLSLPQAVLLWTEPALHDVDELENSVHA